MQADSKLTPRLRDALENGMLVIGFYRAVNSRGSLQDDIGNNSISNWSSYHPLSYTESPKDDGLSNSVTGFYRPVNHTGSPQDDSSNNSLSFGFGSTNNFVRGPDKTVIFLWPRFLCEFYFT